MSSIVEESLLRNFKIADPIASSKMVRYEMPDSLTLIVTLNDGRKILYDDLTDSTRYLNPDPDNMTEEEMLVEFRFKLRRMMSLRGYNQLRLAEETGIASQTISRYLSGASIPPISKTARIAKVLGCSLDELWYT